MAHLLLGPPALILQVDGPEAFTSNEPYMPLGQTLIAWRRLRTRGRKVRDAISPVEPCLQDAMTAQGPFVPCAYPCLVGHLPGRCWHMKSAVRRKHCKPAPACQLNVRRQRDKVVALSALQAGHRPAYSPMVDKPCVCSC